MTERKYYIVTEEELDQIKNDCAFPEKLGCEDGCEYWDEIGDLPCKFKGANVLMDEVLTHTLEEELQKERERVLMKLQDWILHMKRRNFPKNRMKMHSGISFMK